MFKNTKRLILAILVIYYIAVSFLTLTTIQQVNQLNKNSSTALTTFLSLQLGGGSDSVVLQISQMLLLPTLSSGLFIYLKNNNSFINLHQRISYQKFLSTGVLFSFIGSVLIMLSTYALQLILISLFCAPIVFTYDPHIADMGIRYFSLHTGLELGAFILLSSIGWGVFSVLVFSINLFISKNVIGLISGAITGIILILFALIGNLQNNIWRTFSFIVFLPTIISPGQMTFNGIQPPINFVLSFFISIFCYLAISFMLIIVWKKRKYGGD